MDKLLRVTCLGFASVLLYLSSWCGTSHGQFPRVCVGNATKVNATCCPTPPGKTLPCGGPGRGICLKLPDVHEFFWPPMTNHLEDDRINWPVRFFNYACACDDNFQGYMCHECKWGYYGPNCTLRRTLVRRNIFSLSSSERKRFINLLLESKTAPTEFMALKAVEMDPITNKTFKFVNMTMYDYFIFHHYYSARNTYFDNFTRPCERNPFHLDFSHEGSGNPTWHRLFILFWEREFQKLAKDDTFTFPYWDWVGVGKNCEVCTNDLLGAINYSDPSGRIDRGSPFSNWYGLCASKDPLKNNSNGKGCRFCDPEEKNGFIVRRGGTNPKAAEFPDFEHVKKVMAMPDWDSVPFDENAGNKSFRNCFEGNCPRKGFDYSIHNLVHAWFNGSMSGVSTSTNDPMFILHHAFIDKLIEIWIRAHRPHTTQFPGKGAPIGHNRDAVMVPFFPRHYHRWYFVDSRTLGYTYDNMGFGKSNYKMKIQRETDAEHRTRTVGGDETEGPSGFLVSVLGGPIVISAFIFGLILHDRLQKGSQESNNNSISAVKREKFKEAMKDTKYQKLPCEKYQDELGLSSDVDDSSDDAVIFDVKSEKDVECPLLKTQI